MISKDFFQALKDLEELKGINAEELIAALETALTSAYKKNYGESKSAAVKLNPEKNTIRIYSYKTVVETVEDPDKEISLEEAKAIKKNIQLGGVIEQEEATKEFGRIAAQTAKQVMMQKIREFEGKQLIIKMAERQEQLAMTQIKRIDFEGNVFVEIDGVEAIMPKNEQMKGEKYSAGDKIKVYVKKLNENAKFVQLVVSRSDINLVRKLFEIEIPEIQSGEIEIMSISRDAGNRSKVSIHTNNSNLDPIGACVGNKGLRINNITKELNGEKIDLVLYSENPAQYIANALSPAKVLQVEINETLKTSKVIVPDEKLSLAIGKDGQNVRLAAKLTNWKIDVKPQSALEQLDDIEIVDMETTPSISEDSFVEDMFDIDSL